MGKIYKDQTKLTFSVTLGEDLTNASTVLLKYIKPSRETGSFGLSVTDAASGLCSYSFGSGDLDEAGVWIFWGFVTFNDTTTAAGEAYKIEVFNEGQ